MKNLFSPKYNANIDLDNRILELIIDNISCFSIPFDDIKTINKDCLNTVYIHTKGGGYTKGDGDIFQLKGKYLFGYGPHKYYFDLEPYLI